MCIFWSEKRCWANLWSRNTKSLPNRFPRSRSPQQTTPCSPHTYCFPNLPIWQASLPMPPLPSSSLQVPSGVDDTITTRKRGTSSARAPSNPKMEEFLKSWRQDALNKHQYDAAIFIGDKLLALTGTPLCPALPKLPYRILIPKR